jgi:uncharacterized tellurite resistance protein B-like protein
MRREQFVLDLGKLMIAAAWADGELSGEEINALKDVLFSLPEVNAETWAQLEIYMDHAVTEAETTQLLEAVLGNIRGGEDKAFVSKMIHELFESDREVTAEEAALLEEIKGAVGGVSTNVLSRMAKAMQGAMGQHARSCAATTRRESRMGDYIHNTIYYALENEMERSGTRIDKANGEVRKICLAAGLMARIAHVDDEISDDERRRMQEIVAADWQLSEPEAQLIVRISCDRMTKGLDRFRLSRSFYECTTVDERRRFLVTLFKIANAAEKTSFEEIEEIRTIATILKLEHEDFIKAKLSVPREDRKGL